jgi:hypothetical protein
MKGPEPYVKPALSSLAVIIVSVVVAWLLWNNIVLFRFKLFVVLAHEISHGLMAIAPGGSRIKPQIALTSPGLHSLPAGRGLEYRIGGSHYRQALGRNIYRKLPRSDLRPGTPFANIGRPSPAGSVQGLPPPRAVLTPGCTG